MTRWWMSVAVTVVWLGQVTATRAQYLPCPPPAAPPQEPVPYCLSEPATPGPLPPQTAPPGPADCLGLPDSVPGAFMDCAQREECHWFTSLGAQGLQRQGLGHIPLVYLDPATTVGTGVSLDTGIIPLLNRVSAVQDVHDVHPHLDFGPRGTIGYLWGNQSVEFTGYYIPEDKTRRILTNPGALDVFFVNPPVGFEGDNGLWLQADRVRTSFTTAMANTELNYRYWNKAVVEAELILGVRYIDLQEKLRIFTDDDGITTQDIFGNPDTTRQATYQIRTHNEILAPQMGFEATFEACCWLSCVLSGKAGFGADYYEIVSSLQRGDGLTGLDLHRYNMTWCHMYEMGFFLDFHLLERLRLRAGYQAFWVLHVPEATEQVRFDLSRQLTDIKEDGSIFYHGPTIELQFLF